MESKELRLPAADADKLLACADGLCALLYIHILRTGSFCLSKASRELKRSESDIVLAAGTLRRLGLLEKVEAPLPSREMPEFTAGDVSRRADSDKAFEAVVDEAQHRLGRTLNSNDLRLLLGIYDHLGLPADVIMLLLNHCIEEYQFSNGEGRMPTMRQIEKEAWFWAEQEINTFDAAEEHIRRSNERRQDAELVKEALQITGRALTATEKKYVDSWLSMGYDPETIAIAYDRTVTSTGKLAWRYMDRIITSWNEKKLYTPQEIASGDQRYVPKARARSDSAPAEEDVQKKIERMRKLNKYLNGNKEN